MMYVSMKRMSFNLTLPIHVILPFALVTDWNVCVLWHDGGNV